MSAHSDEIKYSDPEKALPAKVSSNDVHATSQVLAVNDGVNRETGIFGKMWKVVLWADSFGVEVRGIERVPEDERHHLNIKDAGWMWLSANMTISTFALGALGKSIWYMGLTDSILTIVFFNLLCTIPVALFSTWGMRTGLRQMVLGRFSFGWLGVLFPVLLNCIACVGWSIINTIAGASALRAVSDTHKLPTAAGTVIIALLTLFVALFGYKYVHAFERYASYPVVIIFILMLGATASAASVGVGGSGPTEAASVLSFGSAIAGFALGWTSLAADYTVNLPADSPKFRVFLYTYMGLNLPLIFVESLGAICINPYLDIYQANGIGGLLAKPLEGFHGFGSFLLVLLALSIVANNIPNMYSFALTFQVFGPYAQAIPRMFLVIIGTVIYTILAIVAADHFESFLDTMLLVLAYWLAIYTVILLEEHFIFRKGSFVKGYELDRFNDRSYLPIGIAALACTALGAMGAVLGMSQTWYVGKIAILVGGPPYGGDVGFELSGGFTAVSYPLLRYLELKFIGR